MTGQRDMIEVIRDCLKILGDVTRLYQLGRLTEYEVEAIEKVVQENLDALLAPMRDKLKEEIKHSVVSASEPSN